MFKDLLDYFKQLFTDTAVSSTITTRLKINGLHTGSVGFGAPKEMYAALDAADVPFMAKTADGSLFDPIQVARARVDSGKTNIHTIVYRRSLRIDGDPYDPNVPNYNQSPYDAAVRHWAFHSALFSAEIRDNRDIIWVETMNEVGAELVFDNEAEARAVPTFDVREVFSRINKDGSIDWVVTNAEWLAAFAIETARMSMADGYRWAAFGFAGGNPEPEHWRGPKMVEFLKLCAANLDRIAIALHEYSWMTADIWNGRTLTDSGAYKYDLIGRFTRLIEACDAFGVVPYPTLMITEWGWAERDVPEPKKALADIKEVGELYARYNVNAAVWYLGPGFGSIDSQTQKLIQPLWDALLTTTYEVEPVTPPTQPPDPAPDCRGLPRVQYKRVVNVLPPEITLDEATAVFRARWQAARETVTGSYDDAGIGALDDKTAVLYGIPPERHAEFLAWYQTEYSGTEVVFENTPLPPPDLPDFIDAPALAQCDPAWANELCGFGPKTLCQWGCLLTVYTMWLRYYDLNNGRDVLAENEYFKTHGGFSGSDLVSMAMDKVYATVQTEGWMSFAKHGAAMHTKTRDYLARGIPVPAQVDFKPGTAAWEQHWVLLVGWDEDRQDYLMNDPWTGKKAVYVSDYYAIAGSDVLQCIYYYPETPDDTYTGPPVTFVAGVDNPASDWRWPEAKSVFDKTGLAVKFHTQGNNHTWWSAYKNGRFNLVRILLDPNFNGDIFQETAHNIAQFYNVGARDFEVLNEPNIEGMGVRWSNGAEFGAAFKVLCARYTAQFPGIRLWFPGCSPQFGGQYAFIDAAAAVGAFQYVWGMCEHVYTGIVDNEAAAVGQMADEVIEFRRRYALTRPLAITEFSVNQPAPAAYKAAVYHQLYTRLASIPGIQAAYSFTSSWFPTNDAQQEGWLEYGIYNAY